MHCMTKPFLQQLQTWVIFSAGSNAPTHGVGLLLLGQCSQVEKCERYEFLFQTFFTFDCGLYE
jgi:hypothetical protein